MGGSVGRLNGWASSVFALLFREETAGRSGKSRPRGFLHRDFRHCVLHDSAHVFGSLNNAAVGTCVQFQLSIKHLCSGLFSIQHNPSTTACGSSVWVVSYFGRLWDDLLASTQLVWRFIGCKREVFVIYGLQPTEWG